MGRTQHKLETLTCDKAGLRKAVSTAQARLSQHQRLNRQLLQRDLAAATALLRMRCSGGPPRAGTRIGGAPASERHPKPVASSAELRRAASESTAHAMPQSHRMLATSSAYQAAVLFCKRPLPRPVCTFTQHAACSFQDLSSASGGLSMGDMLPSFATHVRAYRSAQAARMQCHAEDVCWHYRLRPEVAPGVPLSCSCQLGSQECTMSFLLFWLLAVLELAFLTDEAESLRSAGTSGVRFHASMLFGACGAVASWCL
jgi:hypothetical protein